MDTNPMVQGNDTLTDCLNGTLITMNGNEVILQNDMGNRRVDSAFLPSGYQPVGMKEYGGVIYVAAYNPITNKSQIGSFPSPQRKISTETSTETNGEATEFNFSSFINKNNGIVEQDSFLKPLTKDNVLHAGDKFTIYANGLSAMRDKLTNYNNVVVDDHTKAKTPKNRLYTISIGILNSQNEFVDITKSLVRWDDWNQVQNSESDWSDTYKFNVGYFIPDEFNGNLSETISDSKLIKERQKLATNTYAYKLAGPLYLKVELNHIQTFDYNITGTYDSGKANLQIEAYITYNCPDNAQDINDVGNTSYKTFEEGLLNFGVFDFIKKNVDKSQQILGQDPNIGIKIERSVYNPNTNLYSAKITKSYTNVSPSDGNILNYRIGVIPNADSDYQNVYLKGLSVDDSIDLSLLNSGKVFIKEWKFYNNIEDGTTILKLGMSAYPVLGTEFKNLRFEFIDHNDNSKKFYFPNGEPIDMNGKPWFKTDKTVNNGRQVLELNQNQIGLEKNKLYEVNIYYDICEGLNTDYKQLKELDGTQRWFLTTELFNDLFNNPIISDLCSATETDGKDEFQEKLKIKLRVNEDNLNFNIQNKESFGSGGFVTSYSHGIDTISYIYEQNKQITVDGKSELEIINEKLYPDCIKLIDSSAITFNNLIWINGEPTKENFIRKGLLSTISSENSTVQCNPNFNITFSINRNTITINSSNQDYFISGVQDIAEGTTIKNAFSSYRNFLQNSLICHNFAGFRLTKKQESGPGDDHDLYLIYNYGDDNSTFAYSIYHEEENDYKSKTVHLKHRDADHPVNFIAEEYLDDLFDKFEEIRSPGQTFMFMFPNPPHGNGGHFDYYYYATSTNDMLDSNLTVSNGSSNGGYTFKARVWLKTDSDRWVLVDNLVETNILPQFGRNSISRNINDFINSFLENDFYYRVYDVYKASRNKYFVSDKSNYSYNNEYNIPIKFKINYLLSNNNIINNLRFGNLKFENQGIDESNNRIFTFNIKSSEQFHDNVIEYLNSNEINGIDLTNGSMVDSNGNKLDPNGIYKCVEYLQGGITKHKLEKVESPKLTILPNDQVYDGDNGAMNVLVLKYLGEKGIPEYRYDTIYGTKNGRPKVNQDGTTRLDYRNVPILKSKL